MEQGTTSSDKVISDSGLYFGSIQLADIKTKADTRNEVYTYIKMFHMDDSKKRAQLNFKVKVDTGA